MPDWTDRAVARHLSEKDLNKSLESFRDIIAKWGPDKVEKVVDFWNQRPNNNRITAGNGKELINKIYSKDFPLRSFLLLLGKEGYLQTEVILPTVYEFPMLQPFVLVCGIYYPTSQLGILVKFWNAFMEETNQKDLKICDTNSYTATVQLLYDMELLRSFSNFANNMGWNPNPKIMERHFEYIRASQSG